VWLFRSGKDRNQLRYMMKSEFLKLMEQGRKLRLRVRKWMAPMLRVTAEQMRMRLR
jgi:hypothetical protein